MNASLRLLAMTGLVACAASAQPVVNAVLNNASYALPGLPNSGIARGSLFAVFGTGLAAGNATATSFPLSASMGGTSIRVTVGATSVDALMIYTTPGQVGAVLPSGTPEGAGQLVLTLNGQASSPASITVVRSAFGTFTVNQGGSGPGAIQIVNSESDRPVVGLTRPARPGQTMIIWGTGLGPTTANEAAGPVPGDLAVNVEVYVGGRRATVSYKGRSGCCSGIDQIAFVVPEGVEGCYVPVVVKIDDMVSNFSTISVARSGNTCTDPAGLSGQEILSAETSGSMSTGVISLSRTSSKISAAGFTIDQKSDIGAGVFSRYNFGQLLAAQNTGGSGFSVSLGACSVATFRTTGNNSSFTDPVRPTFLDAGPAITVVGPRGTKQLTRQNEIYTGDLGGGIALPPGIPSIPGLPASSPDFLEPGSYQISAPGGAGVGSFNVNFTMPQMVTWTNEAAITAVTRSAGQNITWTGGDPAGYVQMIGFSTTANTAATFICMERASAGSFTIPSYVLSLLPATTGNNIGFLSVAGVTATQPFRAQGLNAGYVVASSATQKTVNYR